MKTILLVIVALTFSACNHQVKPVLNNNIPQCNALSMESDIVLEYQADYSYDIVTSENVEIINEYYDLNVSVDDIVYGYCGLED